MYSLSRDDTWHIFDNDRHKRSLKVLFSMKNLGYQDQYEFDDKRRKYLSARYFLFEGKWRRWKKVKEIYCQGGESEHDGGERERERE